MASVVSGTVTIGGIAFGAVEADIKLDDGNSYHFVGYYADAGVGVGVCDNPTGDFPGESHILGGCFMEVIQVPGGMGVAFNDFHGEIGQVGGLFKGAVIELGVGGGTWTSASAEAASKKADKVHLELEHVFADAEAEDESSAK